jgi:hypothetical protein
LGEHPRTRTRTISRSGWGGYVFRSYSTEPVIRREPLTGDYAAFLYLSTSSKVIDHNVIRTDIPEPSLTMYHERGGSRYRLRAIYTLNLT